MNYRSRCVSLGLLGVASACVLSEPIGENPLESSTGGEPTGDTSAVSASSGNESLSGGVESTTGATGGVLLPTSTESDTEGSGSSGGFEVCSGVHEDNFSWQWSLGSYEPEFQEDAGYDYDSAIPLECDVLGFDEDVEGDELSLTLDCEANGTLIEEQHLSLSPIPTTLVDGLLQAETFSVFFRPEPACNNACYFVDAARGWLAIRRTLDDQLMLGIVDAHRPLSPVDELAPITVEMTTSECPRIFEDSSGCADPGWRRDADLSIGVPGGSASITGAGEAGALSHRIFVNHAFTGQHDTCGADQGDPNSLALMVVRVFAIK